MTCGMKYLDELTDVYLASWPLDEIIKLQKMFIQRYGPNVLPSQVLKVDTEGWNPKGPRYL